jgi:hypothetical protein
MIRTITALFAGASLVTSVGGAAEPFRWPEGKRVAVSLSFDDARTSQIDVGLPLLDRYGVKATFYVNPPRTASRLDGWKKAAAGGHELGSHSNTHPCTVNYPFSASNALETYTLDSMAKELDTATADLQRIVGVKPVTFAYPCGQKFVGFGADVKSYVPLIAARFLAGRGFRDEEPNDPTHCDLSQILGMESDGLSFAQMQALVSAAAERGAWLVFAGHEIGPAGRQTTEAEALKKFLVYAREPANGIWIDTVGSVAQYVKTHRSTH